LERNVSTGGTQRNNIAVLSKEKVKSLLVLEEGLGIRTVWGPEKEISLAGKAKDVLARPAPHDPFLFREGEWISRERSKKEKYKEKGSCSTIFFCRNGAFLGHAYPSQRGKKKRSKKQGGGRMEESKKGGEKDI